MPDSLKTLKSNLDDLAIAAQAQGDGTGRPPVETWDPDLSGDMDLVIRRDGTWWHEGGQIKREALVKLFASIMRKDKDGETYLLTPVEKWRIEVEAGHFLAIRMDVKGKGEEQRIFFTTHMDEVVEAGPERPIFMQDGEPYVRVRGRLDALLTRSVFYDLAQHVVMRDGVNGVWAGGEFFVLGDG